MREPLTVVLVHRDEPERCVRAGRAFLGQDVAVRLVVVDNASRPAARDALAARLPECELVALDRNAGFGPAANAGLARWMATGTPPAGLTPFGLARFG